MVSVDGGERDGTHADLTDGPDTDAAVPGPTPSRRTLLKTGAVAGSLSLVGSQYGVDPTVAQDVPEEREYTRSGVVLEGVPASVQVHQPDPLVRDASNLVAVSVRVDETIYRPGITVELADQSHEHATFSRLIPGSFPSGTSLDQSPQENVTTTTSASGEAVDGPWDGGRQATFALLVDPIEVADLTFEITVAAGLRPDGPGTSATGSVTVDVGPPAPRRFNPETLAQTARQRARLFDAIGGLLGTDRAGLGDALSEGLLHLNAAASTLHTAESFAETLGVQGTLRGYVRQRYLQHSSSVFRHANAGQLGGDGVQSPDSFGPSLFDDAVQDTAGLANRLDRLSTGAPTEALEVRVVATVLARTVADLARDEARAWADGRPADAFVALANQYGVLADQQYTYSSTPPGADGADSELTRQDELIREAFVANSEAGVAVGRQFGLESQLLGRLQDDPATVSQQFLTDLKRRLQSLHSRTGAETEAVPRARATLAALGEVVTAETNRVADVVSFLDANGLRRAVSAGWLSERFMERPGADSPFFGEAVSFDVVALFDAAGTASVDFEPARTSRRGGSLDWDGGVTAAYYPLLSPMLSTIDDSYYTRRNTLVVAGTATDDQVHYDKYGKVPVIPIYEPNAADRQRALSGLEAADIGDIPPGTELRVHGVIERTPAEAPYDGPAIRITDLERIGRFPTNATPGVDQPAVLGLHQQNPVITDYAETTEYTLVEQQAVSYPTPGSLVSVRGRDGGTGIEVESFNIIVGDATREPEWEADQAADLPCSQRDLSGDDIVVVVDTSGSMTETDTDSGATRLRVAKDATKSLVDFVADGTNLGIAEFSERGRIVSEMREVTDDTVRAEIKENIEQLGERSGTCIGCGMLTAQEMLLGVEDPSNSQNMFVLSDGDENREPTVSDALDSDGSPNPDIVNTGIQVHSVGIGLAVDPPPQTLREMTNATDGILETSAEPGDIRRMYVRFSGTSQGRSRVGDETRVMEEGNEFSETVAVDGSMCDLMTLLGYPGSTIEVELTDPDGEAVSETDPDVSHRVSDGSDVWRVQEPRNGAWSYTASAVDLPESQEANVGVNSDSSVSSTLYDSEETYDTTGVYKFELQVLEDGDPYPEGEAQLIASKGDREWEVQMNDDGENGDAVANDGIYTGNFHPEESGRYDFTVRIAGGKYDGLERSFTRTVDVSGSVDEPDDFYLAGPGAGGDDDLLQYLLPGSAAVGGVAAVVALYRLFRGGDKPPGGSGPGPGRPPTGPGSPPTK